MKITLAALLLLSACATVTSGSGQKIRVVTEPAGASCSLANGIDTWTIEETPGTAEVKRSFTPLNIYCQSAAGTAKQTLEPRTRGRAYGNILLLGLPAAVDASTGAGYEYSPDSVTLTLSAE